MQRNRIVSLICLVVIVTSSLSSQSIQAQDKLPRLAFVSFADDNWDIYVWDRSTYVNVTNSPETEYAPIWSNDGRLAYLSVDVPINIMTGNVDYDPDIYVWDGKTSTRIGRQDGFASKSPTWSSDGKLAYVGSLDDGSMRVLVWNGTESIDVLPDATRSNSPAWSVDGRLAFEATVDENTDVYVWDGKAATNISEHPKSDFDPAWSADSKLAFGTYRDGDKREIYLWDGKALTNISQNPEEDYPSRMAWSTDGKLVYDAKSEQGDDTIMVWDGTTTQRILEDAFAEFPPIWSPDNQLLIIYHDEQGEAKADVWNGKTLTTITTEAIGTRITGGSFSGPDWNSDSQLAIIIPIHRGEDDMGPIVRSTVFIWDHGQLTEIETPVSSDGSGVYFSPELTAWSSDNWLAWQAAEVHGDAVGGGRLFVWDGTKTMEVSPKAESSNQNPVWEPGG